MTIATQRNANPLPAATFGRSRRAEPISNRVRRDGKFFRLGQDKFHVKGVTYGPFEPNEQGLPFPSPAQARQDMVLMLELGANTFRVYHRPPRWLLDLALEMGLRVLIDVPWPKHLVFIDDEGLKQQGRDAVRSAARECGNHPAVFAISVVNEIPADIVRYSGPGRIADFIDELVGIAREEAPDCLVTFANYPTTEYLQPRDIDFVCFNVYLHDETVFRNYLARLQNISADKPLMLGEYGIDTLREHNEQSQAEILARHVRAVFEEGCAGTFIFSFTDDWFTGGYRIEDWAFGLTRRDRSKKPAFDAIRQLFARAPQTSEIKLPKVSVIICSYNGASTVEACLKSMERLRYPDYEVIFVDDGSTDATPDILQRFPWVRYIRQQNMGLSYARNVGLAAAEGEIVAYTDSDCEADEDWLYHLVLALTRGSHVGVGGPNLIPDEGSWVADCVGLSPGGPTHVMIDDRTAEHVPGCNMAFYTWAAREINGFDPQFRKAGDDVDFIWRLQHRGYTIGFAPAAQVWHYRRNTVTAYLKQQRGYGEAEALLKYKHPDHFNTLGAGLWRGRIYGGDAVGVRLGSDVVYHGVFGTGLFQTIYRQPASLIASMLMSLEWHLLSLFMLLLGMAFPSLLYVAGLMVATPLALSLLAAFQVPMPRHRHRLSRLLIAYLHYRQPITRGMARYMVRLRQKVLKPQARGYRRSQLPFDPKQLDTLRYWQPYFERSVLLESIKQETQIAGLRLRIDSGWQPWDMEIYGSRYVKVRLTTVSEHHAGGYMTKVRVEMLMSTFCRVLMGASLLFAAMLTLKLWPFSRPAMLIPLTWWGMFVFNRWRVAPAVLGLIDVAAEKANFWAVTRDGQVRKPREPEPSESEPTGNKTSESKRSESGSFGSEPSESGSSGSEPSANTTATN